MCEFISLDIQRCGHFITVLGWHFQVFVVGGNGGNAAAHAIAMECQAQGVVCSVVGVPKSIDNDILLVRGEGEMVSWDAFGDVPGGGAGDGSHLLA